MAQGRGDGWMGRPSLPPPPYPSNTPPKVLPRLLVHTVHPAPLHPAGHEGAVRVEHDGSRLGPRPLGIGLQTHD
jgi:hypothetical protein